MIPRSTKGSSFAGALRYDLEKNGAELLDTNCTSQNWQEIAKEMDTFAAASSSKKPVLHTSLSLPAGETLTKEQWREAARIYMKEMVLSGHQYALTLHNDAKHEHVHLVINRVNERGRLASDSNDRHRSLEACRTVERAMGLKVIDKTYKKENDGRFNEVKKDLQASIAASKSIDDLRTNLKKNGYELILNKSKTTDRISGASVKSLDDGKTWKMSELKSGGFRSVQNELSGKNIEHTNTKNPHDKSNSPSPASGGGSSAARAQAPSSIDGGLIEGAETKEEVEYLIYLKNQQQAKSGGMQAKLGREMER